MIILHCKLEAQGRNLTGKRAFPRLRDLPRCESFYQTLLLLYYSNVCPERARDFKHFWINFIIVAPMVSGTGLPAYKFRQKRTHAGRRGQGCRRYGVSSVTEATTQVSIYFYSIVQKDFYLVNKLFLALPIHSYVHFT